MLRVRTTFAAVLGASLMSLAACAGDDATEASGTPATTATSAAPAATTEAAAPAGDAPDDKTICNAANKADKAMKAELISQMQKTQGELDGAGYQKILVSLADQLTAAAGSSESEVGKAVKTFSTLATEAGANAAKAGANPEAALAAPGFEKSGTDLTAACKAAGVTVNY
ncbi:hypothetical protein Aab01nite_33810 [Paractinoplanes abujensis]|uniref:Lipoprotein n=1 Tax=Paractinoplanes abujensis TaxID=882441 RepID=A0A7W7G892_9ACTN|nr:hypothetical protein [Actinoplanes abujensis]MBB4697721.1 hypothetical protein [Actinoplanes abujensis]GID19791.1 hypothetical protein Aab01nite_33810 [Actinoplanes abujensis]